MARPVSTPVDSPCIGICRMDEATGLCRGCLRSLAEIAAWSSVTPEERARILAQLPGRRPGPSPGATGD